MFFPGEIKCVDWLDFRKKPSTTVPATSRMMDMPPEAFTTVGEFSNEESFDIWCMGVFVYKLLTGGMVEVFVGNTTEQKTENIITGNYNKDAVQYQELPDSAKDLIASLLQVDKGQRTSLFFTRSFDKWLTAEPVTENN